MKLLIIPFLFTGSLMAAPHPDFVSLSEICPDIIVQASYSSAHNFTGEIVAGYKAQKAFLAKAPAAALCEVQKAALTNGFSLKIFDGYRPVKAVEFFQLWAKKPEENPELKELYYPKFTRRELFENGYISKRSSHSRGSAVDLTLVDIKSGKDLDMGSGFDYFDDISHTDSTIVTAVQRKNRMRLKELMEEKGFKNYSQEWWHFSFRNEPFPDRSFDFDIE
jgi:zinc D-Ala-D-Ala dipeptidase